MKAMENFENDFIEVKKSSIPTMEKMWKDAEAKLRNETLALNLWERKWNLIIYGIPGSIKEDAATARQKFRDFLVDPLDMDYYLV